MITFCLCLGISWSTYSSRTGLIGWITTVVWTLPTLASAVGLLGALLTSRRMRRQRHWGKPQRAEDDTLLVVVPTIGRHDTYPALERAVLSYAKYLPGFFPHLRIDIITEEGCEAQPDIDALALTDPVFRVVVVPRDYRTPNGTRFKARANNYSHELRIAEGEAVDDVWVLHMDDDTGVGADTAAAMARFINAQRRAGADAKHLAQGVLTYPRELAVNRMTWLADSVRPSCDITLFAVMTGSGTPYAGLHGELLLIRSSIEATIGWDFGPKAIVEDAQLALHFCARYKGRSDWFSGACYGASPATMQDLMKQRERWAWGLIALAFNRTVPLKSRLLLMYNVTAWTLGLFQHVGIILALGALLGDLNTSPFTRVILPLWAMNVASGVWMYWEGLKLNVTVSADARRAWWEPIAVVGLIPFFSLYEGLAVFRGFLRFLRGTENKFVVIAKPA
ncbi:glycosyltransferase family 2 protein [Kitasatospora viridis]|uniref:glycosyltransferase family 2 protein n=1 Tax=Kitasatospora viridis TaxID=281105 RepID=UPI0031D3A01F